MQDNAGNGAVQEWVSQTPEDGGLGGILGEAESEVGLEGEVDQVELDLQIDAAGTAAGQAIEARIDVLDDLHNDSEPVRVSNSYLGMIEAAALISTGAASAGIGGAASAQIAKNLGAKGSKLGEDFVKAAFKDIIDGRIDSAAKAGVTEIVAKFLPVVGGPAHDAYFNGQALGLRTQVAGAEMVVKRKARELALQDEDPVEVATAFAEGLKWSIVDAPPQQRATGVSEWLNLNAKMDLGEVEEGQGTDLRGMEWDNKSWREIVMDEPAYGVIRAEIVGLGTGGAGERYVPNNVHIAGTNTDFIDEIKKVDMTLEEMGLNLFVSGYVWQNIGPTSWVEFGMNDGGQVFIAPRSDLSEAWLGFYGHGLHSIPPYVTPSDPEEWVSAREDAPIGAVMIIQDFMKKKPKDLDLKHG